MASRTFADWVFGTQNPSKDLKKTGKPWKTCRSMKNMKKHFVFGEHPAVCRTPLWHPSGSLKSCSEHNSVGPHALAALCKNFVPTCTSKRQIMRRTNSQHWPELDLLKTNDWSSIHKEILTAGHIVCAYTAVAPMQARTKSMSIIF